jgi:hypothetical protein
MDQLTSNWPESELKLFECLNRAPTAMNQQAFRFEYLKDQVTVVPLKKEVGMWKFDWLDAGIAAAHACIYFDNS